MLKQLENLIKKCQFAIDKNKITEKDIKYLFDNDPTSNKNMAKFMCYFKINNLSITLMNIKNIFDRYGELGKLKDKYSFKLEPLDKIVKEKSFKEFIRYIENIEDEVEKKIQLKNQNKVKSAEYKILDENSEWIAVEPLTFEADKKFGSDSDWCTSKTQAYFNTYSNKKTKLIIFIHKPTEKYYSENPTKSEDRNPDYKLQAQIPRENLKIKNEVIIKPEYFLDLFDEESKKYHNCGFNFNKFLKEINIDSNKLSDSHKIQTNLNEIIEAQNISEEEYGMLLKIDNPRLNKRTGLIDCDNVNWVYLKLTQLPQSIKLGTVNNFNCFNNRLTSLEGCPKEVKGDFYCIDNRLTSLKGCPEKVGGNFYCYFNQLTSLEGGPKEVSGDFNCNKNKLTSLEGCPKEVGGDFHCQSNIKKFIIEEVKKYCSIIGKEIYV